MRLSILAAAVAAAPLASAQGLLPALVSDTAGDTIWSCTDVDQNGTGFYSGDVFLWHRADGSIERITNAATGIYPGPVGISRDGSLVWFSRFGTGTGHVHLWDRGAALE